VAGSLRSPLLQIGISAPAGNVAGFTSLTAPWMRGASAPSVTSAGYVSLLALWMGGACAPRVTPPIPPIPPVPPANPYTMGGSIWDGKTRREHTSDIDEHDLDLQQDEIEVLNLANFVIMLLCQDD